MLAGRSRRLQFCRGLTAVAHIHTATTMSTGSQVKSGKKRKHVEASDSSGRRREAKTAAFIVSSDNSRDGLKPLIASTPSIALTDDTELTLYESSAASGSKDGKKDKGKGRVVASMLHGESAKLEWTSTNRMAAESVPWRTSGEDVLAGQDISDNTAEECSASYALALYNPATSSISLIDAPLHILSHIPKRLKNLAAISSRDPGSNNFKARTELGLAFGTKKAQKAIKAAERNKVDAGAQDLQVLQDVMQQGLTEGLETLPESSKVAGGPPKEGQEIDVGPAVVEAARLAGRPVPDLAADTPEDVYQIFGSIMLTKEYDAITVHPLLSVDAATPQKACVMLPFKRSTWVNDRVKDLVANRNGKYKDKERVLKLKVLVWISTLMAMRTSRCGIDPTNADAVGRQFGRLVGSEAIQGLLERFTEAIRGTKNRIVTSAAETKLLSHLLLACLSYESHTALDYQTLTNDMAYNVKKTVELLKMLGCRMVQPKGKEAERILASWNMDGRTIPDADQGRLKVASLIIPLEFPKEKRGKAKSKGR